MSASLRTGDLSVRERVGMREGRVPANSCTLSSDQTFLVAGLSTRQPCGASKRSFFVMYTPLCLLHNFYLQATS